MKMVKEKKIIIISVLFIEIFIELILIRISRLKNKVINWLFFIKIIILNEKAIKIQKGKYYIYIN